ncbi:MAG: hypothetical protein NT015_18700 [Alphaproteobacteria bacterium]|nr:hypothetical protein [Alphaproteobacteria bacterium]
MRGRWSLGVLVAIVVAIWAATNSGAHSAPVRHAGDPVHVTLSLDGDGPSLRISHDAFAVTLTF